MKLLGRFPLTVANQYVETLSNHGINSEIENEDDISTRYIVGLRNFSYAKIYVSEIDFDEAVSLIKEFETKTNINLKELDGEARRIIIFIFLIFLLGMAALIILKKL